MNREVLLSALGEKIFDLYGKGIFGKVSKQEIDTIVFGYYVRDILSDENELHKPEGFGWHRITPENIRLISLRLRITENRVCALLEQCALLEGQRELSTTEIIDEIEILTKKQKHIKSDLEHGNLRLFMPNRVARRSIEGFLLRNGGIPETSFHSDHLIIRLSDLILALPEEKSQRSFLEKIIDVTLEESRNEELERFKEQLSEKTTIEIANHLSKDIFKSFNIPAGDIVVDKIFSWLRKSLMK